MRGAPLGKVFTFDYSICRDAELAKNQGGEEQGEKIKRERELAGEGDTSGDAREQRAENGGEKSGAAGRTAGAKDGEPGNQGGGLKTGRSGGLDDRRGFRGGRGGDG